MALVQTIRSSIHGKRGVGNHILYILATISVRIPIYVLRNISNRALSDLYLVYLLDICLISFSIYSLPGTSLAPGLIIEYDLTSLLYCSLRFRSPNSVDLLGFQSPYCILCILCTLSIGCACHVFSFQFRLSSLAVDPWIS